MQTEFVARLGDALVEFLKQVPDANIDGATIYKFSTSVWFDIADGVVKSMSVADTKLVPLNQGLNKKYRKK